MAKYKGKFEDTGAPVNTELPPKKKKKMPLAAKIILILLLVVAIVAGVVQETGDSETEVMSQKAVSEKFKELDSVSTTVYGRNYTNTITNANGLGTYRCDCNVKSGDVMFVSFESPISDVVCNFGVYFDDGTTHFDIGTITGSGNNIKYIAEKNVIRVALYITQNVSLNYFTINVESQSLRDRVELNTGDLSLIKLGERPKATGMLFASLEMEIYNGSCLVKYTKDLSSTGYIYHEKGFLSMPNEISTTLEFETGIVIVYADAQTRSIAISQQYAEVPLDAVIIEVFYSYQGEYTKCCWTSPFVKKNILQPNEYCSFSNPKYAESIKSIESAVLGHLYNITYKSVPGESSIYVLNVNASKDSTIKVWFESTSTLQCAFGVYFDDGTTHFDIARLNNNVPFNYVAENNITRVALYIDTYGDVDELSIYADVLGLTEEVKNLKNASASFEIKPLSAKIFQRVGCIGDSYTAGYIYTSNGLLNSSPKNSWPHYMEGLTNNRYENWGRSGSTAKGWVLGAAELAKVKAVGNKCQAYVIGLMINDRTEASWNDYYTPVGSSSDIGTDADSYYAYYYKLVQEVISVNPDAKIFCNTCPKWSDTDAYNQAVKNIVSYCKKNGQNVYLCDLASERYAKLYQNETFVKDYINGHYTAIGYEYMAECYLHVLSDVINENVKEFQNVAYIDFD